MLVTLWDCNGTSGVQLLIDMGMYPVMSKLGNQLGTYLFKHLHTFARLLLGC
jgi:hypothetical protein